MVEAKEENKDLTIKVLESKIDEDGGGAIVEIEVAKNGEKDTNRVRLVKENGDWKVSRF
jgi:ABC-type transporter MlaC component